MKLGKYLLPTLRDAPNDADNVSAKLMIRDTRRPASSSICWPS